MATSRVEESATEPRRPPKRSFSALGARVEAAPIAPGLHIVATPIGNLADVSLRALATLAAADAILAEDTRVSRRLLDRYQIATPLVAYHEHNAPQVRPRILARLAAGEALALISDAGTPLISDPGYKLVVEAVAAGVAIASVPGPSAALTALVGAALPTDRFFFEGFLPAKEAARRERVNALAAIPATLILYEAPGRLPAALADLAGELGPRPAAVARELTKLHEETRRGTLAELAAHYAAEGPPKGEIVIIVGPPSAPAPLDAAALDDKIRAALVELSLKDAAAAVAAETGLPRREVYGRALRLAGAGRRG
jgi:16S rRNA (cytidine1402-2'-O)-methyltransferase